MSQVSWSLELRTDLTPWLPGLVLLPADLLLGLKYLRKLYFANMKSVLEALLAREEQGPFLLELFDSSEYSLVVPGEGPLPDTNPATWLSGAGQAMYHGGRGVEVF